METAEFGLESTVIKLDGNDCVILRPAPSLPICSRRCAIRLSCLPAVVEPSLANNIKPESPGMKYKHYAPKADVNLIDADEDAFVNYVRENAHGKYGLLVPNEDAGYFSGGVMLLLGPRGDAKEASRRLFSLLRRADELNLETVYAKLPSASGEYLAFYNRIVRAAGCKIIKLGKTKTY